MTERTRHRQNCARVGTEFAVHQELTMQFTVHVHPGSRRRSAQGNYAGALAVHVRSRAIDGAATTEVLEVLAQEFGVRTSAVRLLRGSHSRTKTVEIEGDEAELRVRLEELLAAL